MSADPRFPDFTPAADPAGSSLPPTRPFTPEEMAAVASSSTFVPFSPATPPSDFPPVAGSPVDDPETIPERLEHYRVLRREDGTLWELGRGAMGVTFKARDTRLHCDVALKVINAVVLDRHPALRERFLREARAAARLRHPNVAGVFHLHEGDGQGPCFYAMEFIAGETLEARVRRVGPLPLPLALEMVTQVTRALIAASTQGLVHRDLKPANLMLAAGAESDTNQAGVLVKVIDFGLAKAITDNGDLTGIDAFIGTPQFASPEQVSGSAGEHAPDARTDIYSLGVTLWYALTGNVPFPGRNLAEIHDRQLRRPPLEQLDAAGVPKPMRELLESMVALDPGDRPPTPYALAETLRACRTELLPPTDATAATRGTTLAAALPLHARRRRRRRWVMAGLATVGGLMELAWLLGFIPHPARQGRDHDAVTSGLVAAVPERSVAVLPFENLSPEPDNAFLADGLQDDLLTSMAKIRELKVISRSSVLAYRDVAKRGSLRDIGRALGVAHFVEGTVRRAGNRVLVNVQLIDAGSGRQLWAQNYDRTLTDSLTLQGELATEIAGALRATLSPEERARVERRPTENPDAYVLFLRAREYQIRPDILLQNLQAAEQLYEQVVALDPNFALAHARLSQTRSRIAFNYQPTLALQARARVAAETALRLQPDLGEGHLAMGFCRYWADRDYEGALAEFAVAARALPNEAEILRAVGYVHRRQGHWAEALASFERAAVLGPRDPGALEALAKFHLDRRDWPAAARAYDRAVALVPESVDKKLSRARVDLLWHGDLGPLTTLLATVPPDVDPEGQVTFARYDVALLRRDYAGSRRALETGFRETLPLGVGTPLHRAFLEGMVFRARRDPGDADRARNCFEAARAHYEGEARLYPQDTLRHADLGLLYAALGWRDAALGEGRYAAQLRPESKDAIGGATVGLRLARIHALLGEAEEAVALLEHLVTVPVDEWTGFSVQDLRLRPDWDGVRNHPGFQRLVASGGRGSWPTVGAPERRGISRGAMLAGRGAFPYPPNARPRACRTAARMSAEPPFSDLPPTLPLHPDSAIDVDAGGSPTSNPPPPTPAPARGSGPPGSAVPGAEDAIPERLEHYEILRREDGELWELGRGAMGVTFKARDTRLRCDVALKVVHAALLDRHPALRERFLREARAAARLRHPHVAGVFHLHEGGERDGTPCFYAMEFIAGETLESRVRRVGPVPVATALEIAAQVTRALIAASAQGLVHRDLKPANLMLVSGTDGGADDNDGLFVKVIDFGLAKAATDGGDLTGVNMFIGTPQFASPEQIGGSGGHPGEGPDARGDIYSLGVTIWYALTGKVPFPGRTLTEIHDRQFRPPPLAQLTAAGVPANVAELLESMLAPEPADRPATPYVLAEALRRCRESLPASSAAASSPRSFRADGSGDGERAATTLLPLTRRRQLRARRRRVFLATTAGLLLLGAGGVAGRRWWQQRGVTTAGEPADRSVAVLPFDNLSADPDNAFLADGLQDDVLTGLAKIGDLKVISRHSVNTLRGAARPGLREIGASLGVAHVLEGSVRRDGGQVRVNVRLLATDSGRQVWAESYNRSLAAALDLQGELAERIATALHATLSPQETARVVNRPTADPEAHVLYQRGREYQNRLDYRLDDLRHAESLFTQAVRRDPGFAVAHARLSEVRSQICHNYGPSAASWEQAREAAETALRLAPDGGEGRLAHGLYLYWQDRDFPRALGEFARASRALPNSPEPVFYTAAIHRRQGRWEDSRAGFERARSLDPVNPGILQELANIAWATRDWPTARRHYDRLVALAPDDVSLRLWRARIALLAEGRWEPLRAALASVPPGVDPEGEVTLARFEAAMLERDLDAAAQVLAAYAGDVFPAKFEIMVHKRYLEGLVHLARGGPTGLERARECFEAARPTYEAAVRESPRDAFQRANLGQLYAALGWREAAVAEGQRAVELLPEGRDAVDGPTMQVRLARIYARLGDAERALPIIEHLLAIPVWEGFTLHELRLRPEWAGLRDDPGFQRLVAVSTSPATSSEGR